MQRPRLAHRTRITSSQGRCSLFKLPPELRNAIYELVLVAPGPIDFAMWSPTSENNYDYSDWNNLLRTCRLIYREASPVVYGLNDFLFNFPFGAKEFFSAIGPEQAKLVRGIGVYWLPDDLADVPRRFSKLLSRAPNVERLEIGVSYYQILRYKSTAIGDLRWLDSAGISGLKVVRVNLHMATADPRTYSLKDDAERLAASLKKALLSSYVITDSS